MNKKDRFILVETFKDDSIKTIKGADSSNLKVYDIIDMQEDLTISEVENKINWFIDNGYYQMADYKAEIMQFKDN